jgi:hypothetical protein
MRTAIRLTTVCASLLAPAAAFATTYTFSTLDSPFDPGIANQGFWSDTQPNIDSNQNYMVGYACCSTFPLLRNFFSFDLTALPALDVISATLQLVRYGPGKGNEPLETYELFDVATDAATLNQNEGLNAAIFTDLGSGTSYGAFEVANTGGQESVIELGLNDAALAAIEAARGGFFSIGGSLVAADNFDSLFGGSGTFYGEPKLVVEVVPEPATGTLLLLGLLCLSAGASRARQT